VSAAYHHALAAQRIASDPQASVFVTANAGSGKTKVLVDRIARLLLTGAAPSAFLCITYTKAAASEMQRRLFEQLGAWCVMDDESLLHALRELIGAPVSAMLLGQARALFARALESPGGLKIQTIHAFCDRLLRRFPFEARVAPGFEIADDAVAEHLIDQAWRRALADEQGDLARAVDHLAGRLSRDAFGDLRTHLMGQRDIISQRLAGGLEPALHEIDHAHGEFSSRRDVLRDVLARADRARFATWAEAMGIGGAKDQAAAKSLMDMARCADDELALSHYFEAFLTGKGEVPKKGAAPTKKVQEHAPWLLAPWQEEAAQAHEAFMRMKALDRRDDARAAMQIADAMIGGFAAAKSRAGVLDFNDLVSLSRALLTERAAAGWVLYKLDGGLQHILVDEGQDTSPDQWALLAPLQEEFFAGAGARSTLRTVFAVGDPKQSIYAFQGAEPERFLAESQALESRAREANLGFAAPELAMSFRSAPEILNAVDATFERANMGAGRPELFDRIAHFAKRNNEIGLVEWWPLTPAPLKVEPRPWDAPLDQERGEAAHVRLSETIAQRVGAWIEQREGVWEKGVLRAMRPGDVMALVRSRGPLFHQLLKAFKRAGLPVAGADRMRLSEELVVQDLLAMAKVALDPHDDLSLCCVLKGPFCGLIDDDADLFPLAYGREPGVSVYDRLLVAPDRYGSARAFVQSLVEQSGAHPHRFFSTALEQIGVDGQSGVARIFARLGEAARDPLDEVMGRALNAGPLGICHLHAFVHAIETDGADIKRQQDESDDAIAVMTVHGAKGLERPVVFVPQTADAVKASPSGGLIAGRGAFVLLGAKDDDDAACAAARAEYAERAAEEHQRLLYVAMTRARDRLIVCGYANEKSAQAAAGSWHEQTGRALSRIGVEADTPFGTGYRLGEALRAQDVVAQEARGEAHGEMPAWLTAPARSETGRIDARPSGAGGISPRRNLQARLARGRLIHSLLQRLPDVADDQRRSVGAAWLKRQREAGEQNLDTLLEEALGVLDDPAFGAVFGPGSRAEVALTAALPDGRQIDGMIDRLVVSTGEVLIIDFKSDRPPPARVEQTPVRILLQMALYREAVRAIFPGLLVRCGLIWTLAPRLDALPDEVLDGVDLLTAAATTASG
jgi:ATP-dependent helicase/nuclease subunit A